VNHTPTQPRRVVGRRTSDAVQRRALEIAHLGWWQVEATSAADVAKNVPQWSDELFRILGHEPGAVTPSTDAFFAQVPAEDHAVVNAAIQRAFADIREHRVEHRVVRPGGAMRVVEESVSVETDANGKPVRVIGTVLDVTDRRKIEQALRENTGGSGLLAQLVEHSHDAIISAACDGTLTTWNPAAEKMFGWKADEVLGHHARILAPPDRFVEVDANLEHAALGREVGTVETVRVRRDGSLIDVELSASPIIDANGTVLGASAIFRDITQQKRLAAQIQHSQRLESVGRLAGGVAHDFNNLLMAMSSYAELVLMDLPEDSPGREDLRALIAAAERGARLTRQLLAFGRRQVLHPISLDLNRVLRELEGVLRPLTAGDVNLRLQLSHEPTLVLADRAQIEQVVVNLVANARDAMPHGGTLDIETDVVEVGNGGPLPHPSIPPGSYVRLAVRDTGIGMDAEVQSRLFEPFFSTRRHGTSTGMGLATSYGIVKQSGGFITVESVPGQGSTFRVFLPLRPTALPDEGIPESLAPETDDRPPETVLLVEDDDAVRAATTAMLEWLGYSVLGAAAPSEALRMVRDPSNTVDLMLTDVMLPEMTGTQLAKIVHAERPDVRIVCMSGFPDAIDHKGAPDEPPLHYLQKPFSADTLARVLRNTRAR